MHTVSSHGAEIPAIGFGTWTLRDETATRLVAHAIESGYRHVDTAAMYGNEAAVGAGLRAAGLPRDDVFVTTKVWHTDLAAKDLRASVAASLDRLQLDCVDLALIHWPSKTVPLAESIDALNEVRASGMARHIGVSNFPTATLAEAIALSDAPLVCNQVEHHPYLDQTLLKAACRAAEMALVSYCPLARNTELFAEAPVRAAAERTGRTPAQVVLRWHVQQPGIVAIPRSQTPERIVENLAVFDFTLTEAEMASISALASRGLRICDFEFSPVWDAA